MNKVYTDVIVDGKAYTMGGYEDAEYLHRIAAYLNSRLTELKATQGFTRQPAEYRNLMLEMNLVDDIFKARKKAASLETKVDILEKEIYNLKHELVAVQLRNEKNHDET